MATARDTTSPMPATLAGGNTLHLLQGGDELFPAMIDAIRAARHEVFLATYIFHDDDAARAVADALREAGERGVKVGVVVDGFGSKATIATLRQWLPAPAVQLAVFRPVDRWWNLLQPGQLRRLHQKLCAVDNDIAFVGGINLIDDRNDLNHGALDAPRLDFAVRLRGPLVPAVRHTTRALWTRAVVGADLRDELRAVVRSAEPMARARRLLQRLRLARPPLAAAPATPVLAAFVVRDNLRQRRAIERAYVEAISRARQRVDLICPYFYPGRAFHRALTSAARRGVRVRLLLQGRPDYRFAALAAQVLYGELLAQGVAIHEYTPAFLHAKVAVVDGDWSTVGSSNIDPLSLLLNLEANVIVRDAGFANELAMRFEQAVSVSRQVVSPPALPGTLAALQRGFVAWVAHWFLRMAGITGRY
jgi:cardiolipin synthase A/B